MKSGEYFVLSKSGIIGKTAAEMAEYDDIRAAVETNRGMCKIISVAAKLPDGRILSLPPPARHSDLWVDGIIATGQPEIVHGFLMSNGKFVNREEAGDIAFKAHQIKKITKCLMSEDLW